MCQPGGWWPGVDTTSVVTGATNKLHAWLARGDAPFGCDERTIAVASTARGYYLALSYGCFKDTLLNHTHHTILGVYQLPASLILYRDESA
eukprot:6182614-Pleurochrysis_carterae.AAC.2